MVKTSPSNEGNTSSISGWGAKPHGKKQTNKISSIVTNLIKTLKIVHIKKNLRKKKRKWFFVFCFFLHS